MGWRRAGQLDREEHACRLTAAKEISKQIRKTALKFGIATKCCVIKVGDGSKSSVLCEHGEVPLYQGSGLTHSVTLLAPDHPLVTIRVATKPAEARRQLAMMKRCVDHWINLERQVVERYPQLEMDGQRWERFAHDLAWYVNQTRRLAMQNRGIKWTPTPLAENDVGRWNCLP